VCWTGLITLPTKFQKDASLPILEETKVMFNADAGASADIFIIAKSSTATVTIGIQCRDVLKKHTETDSRTYTPQPVKICSAIQDCLFIKE